MNKNKIRKFATINELLHYMYKNKYPKNIINETGNISNKYIKFILLYDDMFTIYYKNGYTLKSQNYYMDLML